MQEKIHKTRCGSIHYWVSDRMDSTLPSLVFLPGLTADHRLFDKQLVFFESRANVLVWDAPAHAASRPFAYDFTLMDKARWLDEILTAEQFHRPILVGQSMGGYVGQMYLQLFPEKLSGFVSIDSAPLQRQYMTKAELWLLKRTQPMYRLYPWKRLVKDGAASCAETPYGRKLMASMMMVYDHTQYVQLVSHGYRMLAEAIEAELPYELPCPTILLCGGKDKAGSTKRYNIAWQKQTGLPLHWLPDAGHNSNTDAPEDVNRIILKFVASLHA